VPYHVVLRAVLEADCLSLALRAVCRMPRSASVNLMLGQAWPKPGGGEVIDVELSPMRIKKLRLNTPIASDSEWLRTTLDSMCAPYGVHVDARPNGRWTLRW